MITIYSTCATCPPSAAAFGCVSLPVESSWMDCLAAKSSKSSKKKSGMSEAPITKKEGKGKLFCNLTNIQCS